MFRSSRQFLFRPGYRHGIPTHLNLHNTFRRFGSTTENVTYEPRTPSLNFQNFGGYGELLTSLQVVVDYLKSPSTFKKAGIKLPKGILLSGPPGIGKTMFAEALAGEAEAKLFQVGTSSLNATKVLGETEILIKKLFATARLETPCVLCLDEIDSIGSARVSPPTQSSEQYRNSITNLLLTELSEKNENMVIVATTNNYKTLDEALIRPGRFDRHISIPLPNLEDREKIIAIHAKNKSLDLGIHLRELAIISDGFSGAKIASWLNEAAILAYRDNQPKISMKHLDVAIGLMNDGVISRKITDNDIRVHCAIREAAHALVGHLLGAKLYKASIKQSGNTHGAVRFVHHEHDVRSKNDLLDEICMLLAGRAGELMINRMYTGSHEKLKAAENIAKRIVHEEGMLPSFSNVITSINSVRLIMDEQVVRATDLLSSNVETWEKIVAGLLKNDELLKDEFFEIVKDLKVLKNSASDVNEILHYRKPGA